MAVSGAERRGGGALFERLFRLFRRFLYIAEVNVDILTLSRHYHRRRRHPLRLRVVTLGDDCKVFDKKNDADASRVVFKKSGVILNI